MDLPTLIIAALAVYRLARAITRERGPGDLFTRLQAVGEPGGWLNDGLNCALCVGFWLSLGAGLLVYTGNGWALWPFAIAGAATLMTIQEGKR